MASRIGKLRQLNTMAKHFTARYRKKVTSLQITSRPQLHFSSRLRKQQNQVRDTRTICSD